MAKYRICKKCVIHHFENCGSCFGFGVYSVPDRPGEIFPVTAGEAIETKAFRGEVMACPECGSTVMGLSNNARTGQLSGAGNWRAVNLYPLPIASNVGHIHSSVSVKNRSV